MSVKLPNPNKSDSPEAKAMGRKCVDTFNDYTLGKMTQDQHELKNAMYALEIIDRYAYKLQPGAPYSEAWMRYRQHYDSLSSIPAKSKAYQEAITYDEIRVYFEKKAETRLENYSNFFFLIDLVKIFKKHRMRVEFETVKAILRTYTNGKCFIEYE